MRLLIINFEYPPLGGGGGVATKQVAEELAKRHTVHVLTTWYRGLSRSAVERGVHVHRVRVPGRHSLPTASLVSIIFFVPAALWRGWHLCRNQSFDLINAQFALPSGVVGAWLARRYRVPFVLSFIGGDVFDPTKGVSPHRYWVLRALIRRLSRHAAICTAISSDIKRRAQELHGVTSDIIVTPLGLVPTPTSANALQAAGPITFITIGRLIPRKNYEVLLSVWTRLPNIRLTIVGSGPLKAKLQKMIQEKELAGRVSLTGFVSEERKQQLLHEASAYISPAHHEGFGIVFLEAMEAGLPIIAGTSGGQTDFLKDGINALLVDPEKADEVVAAINKLVSSEPLRRQMSQNNKHKVKEFYLERTAQTFEAVLLKAKTAYESRH